MKNDIRIRLNNVKSHIVTFREKPILDAQQSNLRFALFTLMGIDLSKEKITLSEFKEYRVEMLKYHIEIIELFNEYYIEDYKPAPYKLRIYPPFGSVDGPVFGSVDPAIIKNKEIRDKYISDLEKNNKIGEMNAFQSALTAVKHLLETPNSKLGIIATLVWFIKYNYKDNVADQVELKMSIDTSQLSEPIKNRIINTTK
ncbi:hypothetical protein RRT02_004609 [Salmonella enterica]|nr:hypothetical protein [Salmonella enterica]